MKLLFDPLRGTASQRLKCTKNALITNIRPHLLIVGSPAGTVKVQLQDENGFLIDESSAVAISTLHTLANAHGYYNFAINTTALKDTTYRVAVVPGGGYTFSESSFLGWCTDWDLRKYTFNASGFAANNDFNAPFDVEIWEKRRIGVVREVDFSDSFESSSTPTFSSTEVTIANGAAATNITGLSFDKDDFQALRINYTVLRRTDSTEVREEGQLVLQYKKDAAAWTSSLEGAANYDDAGMTFTITDTAGVVQVQYATTSLAGANYSGKLRFQVASQFEPTT